MTPYVALDKELWHIVAMQNERNTFLKQIGLSKVTYGIVILNFWNKRYSSVLCTPNQVTNHALKHIKQLQHAAVSHCVRQHSRAAFLKPPKNYLQHHVGRGAAAPPTLNCLWGRDYILHWTG